MEAISKCSRPIRGARSRARLILSELLAVEQHSAKRHDKRYAIYPADFADQIAHWCILTKSKRLSAGNRDGIPSTLQQPGAMHFWLALLLTGVGTGLGAAALTRLLEAFQHLTWRGSPTDILEAAQHTSAWRHVLVLVGAGLLTGAGQLLLKQLSSGNGIDTTAAIWFHDSEATSLAFAGAKLNRGRLASCSQIQRVTSSHLFAVHSLLATVCCC